MLHDPNFVRFDVALVEIEGTFYKRKLPVKFHVCTPKDYEAFAQANYFHDQLIMKARDRL